MTTKGREEDNNEQFRGQCSAKIVEASFKGIRKTKESAQIQCS